MLNNFSFKIDKHHFQEWIDSGVSPKIIEHNVVSLHDSNQVDEILDRNVKRRWKHSSTLVPCWAVLGVNPLTDESTLEGVQIKPDTPQVDKKGKIQKYIGASDTGTAPLFLEIGKEGYWLEVINDKSQTVIITEGAKKAGAGLSLGIPTISIPGVSTCRKSGRLHPWLQEFTGFGRTFVIGFDADVLTKRQVQNATLGLARELSATGSKVKVLSLPPELKGMDDFIAAKGEEAFLTLIENAKTIEEFKQEIENQRKEQQGILEDDERRSKLYYAYKIIEKGWGDALRFNTLKNHIELHGEKLNTSQLRFHVAMAFDIDIQINDAQVIVEAMALKDSYSPVVEYLEDIAARYSEINASFLDNLATKYFGASDPLHNIYLKKQLIAAVARAKRPGCKVDTACILVGGQGLEKSTFWKELFGADWFTDELSDSNEKDELMKLHQFWGLEIPEVEHIYKRKDISTIKKFMSASVDAFRSPYGREVKEHPRACVLVGTSNETDLLNDPTGNRRFWIIPVLDQIPVAQMIRERDEIWATANYLYENGHQWWLTRDETESHSEASKDFQSSDPWEQKIIEYAQFKGTVTTYEVLENVLHLDPGKMDIASSKRVAAILKLNGWNQKRVRV